MRPSLRVGLPHWLVHLTVLVEDTESIHAALAAIGEQGDEPESGSVSTSEGVRGGLHLTLMMSVHVSGRGGVEVQCIGADYVRVPSKSLMHPAAVQFVLQSDER